MYVLALTGLQWWLLLGLLTAPLFMVVVLRHQDKVLPQGVVEMAIGLAYYFVMAFIAWPILWFALVLCALQSLAKIGTKNQKDEDEC